MKDQIMLKDLLYVSEHLSCKEYMVEMNYGFHYAEYVGGKSESDRVLDRNVIVFVIEGSCSFSCDQFSNRVFFGGDMIFLPKSASVSYSAREYIKVMYMAFDTPQNPCDKQRFEQGTQESDNVDYDFAPLKMNYAMNNFINSLAYYLQNGGSCSHLHDIKHKELFLILRWFYTKEQFAEFFYPIIGKNFDFKNFVIDNFTNCNRLDELVRRSNMSANTFMKKFKSEFGMTAYQWMLKQTCNKIVHKALQPGITVKEIMFHIGIDSPTHFNRICKRYFQKTPKELIAFYQRDI